MRSGGSGPGDQTSAPYSSSSPRVLEGARHGDADLVVHPVRVVDDQPQHAALRGQHRQLEEVDLGEGVGEHALDTSLQLLMAGDRHRSPLSREILRAHKKGGFVTHHPSATVVFLAEG